MGIDYEALVTDRVRAIDASGVRRVFDLAGKLTDPINLSIGQPDFDVPEPVKQAAIAAIRDGFNRYTVTQGSQVIYDRVRDHIRGELPGWVEDAGQGGQGGRGGAAGAAGGADRFGTLITSGVSGGLLLAMLACAGPGDQVLIPDPYFVMYRHLVTLTGATPVYVDTYPDFRLTAERIEPLVTERTKMLVFSTPSNPTGVVMDRAACREIAKLGADRGFLVLSDEIYDEFCYAKVERPAGSGQQRCPSPAEFSRDVLLLRGFSKTYGMTGWRMGYAVGPAPIIEQMTKVQQYTFVCAPSMVQLAGVTALDTDMSAAVRGYQDRRDRVVERLSPVYELTEPGGAFYAFVKVPKHLGMTGTEFVERAIAQRLLLIPGSVFSNRDTHFRLSYACDSDTLERGLDVLLEMAQRG